MSEYSATLSAHAVYGSQDVWHANGFWDRICSGFQESLRHIWSEERSIPLVDAGSGADLLASHAAAHQAVPEEGASPTARAMATPSALPSAALSEPSRYTWTLVLSDTDNDFQSVLHVLWLTGLCDRKGCWVPGLRNVQVVHTGDWLNKWDPNPHVLDSFKRLQATIPDTCSLVLLNGNHELSIVQMADQGVRTPMTEADLAYIRQQNLIHVENGVLFLHGYPGSDLLMILKQFQREELASEHYDGRLRELFFGGRFPLFRETQAAHIIGDIKQPKLYFNQKSQKGVLRGQHTAKTLQALGIHTVVHGHKPNADGQQDYELREEIPGIRLINNDNRIRRHGLGGLLFSNHGYAVFLNPQARQDVGNDKILRKNLRKLLRTRKKDLYPAKGVHNTKKGRYAARCSWMGKHNLKVA